MITMSKQNRQQIVETITNDILFKKKFNKGLIQIINSYKSEYNEVDLINDVLKNIINKGYYIESFNPLVIREI